LSVRGVEPYLYLLPALSLTILWTYWPVVGTVQLAFYQWNLLPTTPRIWVGLENFEQLFRLPELGQAVGNTLIYIVGLVPFSVVFPIGIAIVLNEISGRTRTLYRAILFLPVLMAPVVVAIIWRWIMNPTHGILNAGLEVIGLEPINWFQNPAVAIWAIVLITGWKMLGFSVLIFSAGLTNIGRDYFEAAEIDGASRWQASWYVALPLLSPTIMFMLLLTVLLSAQWTFPIINALTQGGPRGGTTNAYFLLWEFGFRNFNIGISSAAAILFFAGFGGLALIVIRLIDRFSFYDA
jgi:multiple sugar transport system permease protein